MSACQNYFLLQHRSTTSKEILVLYLAAGDCIEDESDCPPNTMLLIVGRVGRPECVQSESHHDMFNETLLSPTLEAAMKNIYS